MLLRYLSKFTLDKQFTIAGFTNTVFHKYILLINKNITIYNLNKTMSRNVSQTYEIQGKVIRVITKKNSL